MRRLRLVGPCLLVTCVVGAIVVASALAAPPEYGRCDKAAKVGKVYTGNFTNSGCTTKSEAKTGKYEWFPGALKAKQTSTGGKGVLEEVGKYAVGCESESSTGEYTGTKEGKNIVVKFKGCKVDSVHLHFGRTRNRRTGNVPVGRAGWCGKMKKDTRRRWICSRRWGTKRSSNSTVVQLSRSSVKGSVLVPIKADKMSETFTLKFKSKHGFQTPEYYEEEGVKIKDVLLSDFAGKGYDQSGQTITSTVKNEEKLELNAYV